MQGEENFLSTFYGVINRKKIAMGRGHMFAHEYGLNLLYHEVLPGFSNTPQRLARNKEFKVNIFLT
jgi:hypothetical protein